jgi:hypothetical protein
MLEVFSQNGLNSQPFWEEEEKANLNHFITLNLF